MTEFIHDIIKIKYSKLGYLPGYPYHLISDKEMFNAFINISDDDNEHFFEDNYPNPFEEQDVIYKKLDNHGVVISEVSLRAEYENLKSFIKDSISQCISDVDNGLEASLPDWIYTYMLGEVIYENSPYLDIYDTLALLGASNTNNKFTPTACALCYNTSLKYISTLAPGVRPASVFGEPHVIKQLRLEA